MAQSKNSKRSWKDRQHGGRKSLSKSKHTKQQDTENKWEGEDIEPKYKTKTWRVIYRDIKNVRQKNTEEN